MNKFIRTPVLTVAGVNVNPRNEVLGHESWHVSYNPYEAHYDGATTAVVIDNQLFIVLCGDHKATLQNVQTLDEAIDYVAQHAAQLHRMSEHTMALGLREDVFNVRTLFESHVSPAVIDNLRSAVLQVCTNDQE